jgi:hypothetical protein
MIETKPDALGLYIAGETSRGFGNEYDRTRQFAVHDTM